jgi:hypothetical protein
MGVAATFVGWAGGKGSLTVMAEVPDFPLANAVTVAVPSVTPVTNPSAFTVATPSAELDQVTVAVTISPRPFFTVAESCEEEPTSTVACDGVTVTVAIASNGSGPLGPESPQAMMRMRRKRGAASLGRMAIVSSVPQKGRGFPVTWLSILQRPAEVCQIAMVAVGQRKSPDHLL